MPVTMVRTTALLPMFMSNVPTCPDFVAERAVRQAAITFCEVSRAWRHVSTHTLVGGAHVLVAPPNTAIHEIEFAEWDRNKLTPMQYSSIDSAREGHPEYITQVSPGEVAVYPALPVGLPDQLEISVFLKPLATSAVGLLMDDPLHDINDVIPDFLVSIHGGALARGALGLIFAIPNQPWSDAAAASYYSNQFDTDCSNSFRQNLRGQQRARSRTTSRWM